ncbi:uncharacterized protein [Paramormyrops kingsleyae]|uniref:uncharacterized protein n=1 Tax=Paramormyrops kingsleyae TaxID=1676925 RepID=UPI003B96B17C
MAPFKFGIFYFRDSSIHVESTDIVTPQYRAKLVQVLTRPDLSSEDGWIEVYFVKRKGPQKKVAAKLLLLGDSYKELLERKKAFLRNEDIWPMAVERRRAAVCDTSHDGTQAKKKKNSKTADTSVTSDDDETDIETPQVSGTNKMKMTKSARDKVLSDLKYSLLKRNARTSTQSPSEEDEPDLDTNMDLFDRPQTAGTTELCHGASEEQSVQLDQPLRNVEMHQEVMEALKEIPTLVKSVKDLIATMNRMPPGIDSGSTSSDSSSPASEMIFLSNTRVQVSKSCFRRLNRTRMSLFAQELAVLIFGRDVLASSSLTGKSVAGGTPKDQLDPDKFCALVDTVIAEFPGTNVSDVRAVIRRKCNNESFVFKKKH